MPSSTGGGGQGFSGLQAQPAGSSQMLWPRTPWDQGDSSPQNSSSQNPLPCGTWAQATRTPQGEEAARDLSGPQSPTSVFIKCPGTCPANLCLFPGPAYSSNLLARTSAQRPSPCQGHWVMPGSTEPGASAPHAGDRATQLGGDCDCTILGVTAVQGPGDLHPQLTLQPAQPSASTLSARFPQPGEGGSL